MVILRQLFQDAHEKLNKPSRSNRSETGAHCLTRGTRGSEMQEKQLRKVRQERLAVFNACFQEEGAHHTMLEYLVDPNGVAFDPVAEREALRSRLSVYRQLKIAYNSGAQRKERVPGKTHKSGRRIAQGR